MKKTARVPLVFFNASVILAGLASPTGGSAKLLKYVSQKKIRGIISEIILDEVIRRAEKIKFTPQRVQFETLKIFKYVREPKLSSVEQFSDVVLDPGDLHVFASAYETDSEYLVSLDKKHFLSLAGKIIKFTIISPKGLIEILNSYQS